MESSVSKLAVISRSEMMSDPDWAMLEKVLHNWHSLAEEAFNISRMQTENEKDKSKTDM